MKRVFLLLPYIAIFLYSLYQPIDTDLGWHLKYGEYFFEHGKLLRENIFSSEMTYYLWVNHSWLSDLLTYQSYRILGFLGISILGGITITGLFYVLAKASSLTALQKIFLFPLTLYFMEPLNRVSFRAQLVTLAFTACTYLIFSGFKKGRVRSLIFLPLLFLVWANFHGGFIQGLGLFILWSGILVVCRLIQNNKRPLQSVPLLLSIIVTFFATLINPFGIAIYGEALHHFGNPLSQYIVEWTSFDAYTIYWWRLLSWGLYIGLSIFFLFKSKKIKEYIPELISLFLVFILSFSARRYTWTLLILSIPIIKYLDTIISIQSRKYITLMYTVIFSGIILYSQYLKWGPVGTLKNLSWENYCRYTSCSFSSSEFLKTIPYKNLYTFYDWGGFLIWNYPSIKPSIDGRMSFWRDEKGYSAFENNFYLEQNILDIDSSSYDTVYISPNKPIYRRMKDLVKENRWKLLYEDGVSAIFKRKSVYPLGPIIPGNI